MVLDQFVMLGKTVPEANSDGRQFVCTAGYDLELHQPIRIYPMARFQCPKRWSISRVPVERNPKDSRRESWKIRGDRRPGQHDYINSIITLLQSTIDAETQRKIVAAMHVRSLKVANEERRSLAILLPADVPHLTFEKGDNVQMAPTPDLFGQTASLPVMSRFKWHPRLQFTDEDGHPHDLMLRDWGCYELMRKHGEDYAVCRLEEALNLLTAAPMLCGNLNQHRNSWLIISYFQGVVHARPSIFEQQTSLFGYQDHLPCGAGTGMMAGIRGASGCTSAVSKSGGMQTQLDSEKPEVHCGHCGVVLGEHPVHDSWGNVWLCHDCIQEIVREARERMPS